MSFIPGDYDAVYDDHQWQRDAAGAALAAKIQAKFDNERAQEIIDALPHDTYETGQVIVFTRKFNATGPTYTYACVKGGPSWYCTGKLDGPRTWAEILAFMYSKGLEFVEMFEVSTSSSDAE